jgi:Ion transport protein/Cyclic nucleotide-binding domain
MKSLKTLQKRKWSAMSLMELSDAVLEPQITGRSLLSKKNQIKDDFFPLITGSEEEEADKSKWIFHPESSWKLAWDILSFFIIFYQALTIPYFQAFDINDPTVWDDIDQFITGFFFVDIILSFNTAYYEGGSIISSRKEISKNYLKYWFWVDIITTFPYNLILTDNSSDNKSGSKVSSVAQLLRILRFYRILRLLRLAKLKKILMEIEDYVSSHFLASLLVFAKLVIFAYMIAHWTACLWYYISYVDSQTHPLTWITVAYFETGDNFEIYITALYWAFTTMATVGYGDIYPITNNEITFSIMAMAVACAMFAYTIGSIGGLVSKQTADQNMYREQCVAINSYMKNQKLPKDLRLRARRYLDYIWDHLKQSLMGENEILSLLSEPLREEIFVHTRGQTLSLCQIFSNFQKHFLLQLTKLLEPKTFAPGDVIFEQGEKSNTMYFIQNGLIELYHSETFSIFKELRQNHFFGEISLFTLQSRCCSARCLDFVETFSFSRENLDSLLERNPDASRICEYIYNQCKREDLSILGVKCFLCNEIGHVATTCKKYLLNYNNDESRNKWLNARQHKSKVVKKYILNEEGHKKRLNVEYNPLNVFSSHGNSSEFFSDPDLLNKIHNFNVKEEEDSDRNSSKSGNMSKIEDFLEESDLEDISLYEEVRSPYFNEKLLSSKSLNKIEFENGDSQDFKENPQETINLLIPISSHRSQTYYSGIEK